MKGMTKSGKPLSHWQAMIKANPGVPFAELAVQYRALGGAKSSKRNPRVRQVGRGKWLNLAQTLGPDVLDLASKALAHKQKQ
jgi:hypothetical protein